MGDFFALDVGTNAMRLIQLSGTIKKGFKLKKYAYVPVDPAIHEDTEEGRKKFGETLLGAMQQAGIKTKNVAFGLPASKTYTAIVEIEGTDEKMIGRSIKYELGKYVPMDLEMAEADYSILGISPNDPTKAEVLISSAPMSYAESQMDLIEDIGLNIVAQEPEPIAMARALNPFGSMDARMIIDLGERSTDVVVMYQGVPRLVRSIAGGLSIMAQTVSESLNVDPDQARKFILKFGLAQDQLDGQVFRAMDPMLENYAGELSKSVQFFQSKYPGVPMVSLILSGFAGVIPFISQYLESKTGVPVQLGNPWQLIQVTPEQQQALQNVASEFAVAIGLAERSNEKND